MFFQEIFNYIRANIWVCLLTTITASMVIPPIPSSEHIYYAILLVLFIYSLFSHNVEICRLLVWFYLAALISIVIGNPDPVFKSYERWGLFVLLTGAVFPLFSSYKLDHFRFRLLNANLKVCVLISIISFICYFLGINYMNIGYEYSSLDIAGAFGGITQHSMILAPICMISTIYLTSLLLYGSIHKWLIVGLLLCSIVTIFIAASRSAFLAALFGVSIAICLRYWKYKSKLFSKIFVIVILSAATYPLYGHFTSNLINKQELNEANGGTFASRETKWDARIYEFTQSPIFGIGFASVDWNLEPETKNSKGVVEPGSSWLAVVSMTGIFGAIPFYILLIKTLFRLFKFTRQHENFNSSVLFSLICGFIGHQFAEGYALAGGSFLCYLFWLTLGCGYIYPTFYCISTKRNKCPANL